ncbi:MAG: cyclic nucleotide-binding domain-containing protein [Burkholderiales bacterium]|nr:cyclic nucleotide-binding domain-containing protein [Burkholderiales bacterium]
MDIEELLSFQTDLMMLEAGKTLFSDGDLGDTMYVVMSGEFEVFVRGKLVETATSGAVLGELAMIDGSPRSATVIAKSDSNLMAIDLIRFLALARERPEFALFIMRCMAERLRRLGKLL